MPDRDVRREGVGRWLPRPARQLGHSGSMMTLLGLAWVSLGFLSIRGSELPRLLHGVFFSDDLSGTAWIVTGSVAVAAAWRPPGYSLAGGWLALYIIPAVRAIGNLVAFVVFAVPGGDGGSDVGIHFAIIYGTMVGVVYICSDWPDAQPFSRQ